MPNLRATLAIPSAFNSIFINCFKPVGANTMTVSDSPFSAEFPRQRWFLTTISFYRSVRYLKSFRFSSKEAPILYSKIFKAI